MAKKFIIVGGVAGGASAAARIRRLDEKADIIIYDKGPDISFSNCSLPNYFSGEIKDIEDLVFFTPDTFKKVYNLPAKVNHEVITIKADEHKVVVKNLLTGEEFEDNYDYLILSPGAKAVLPRSIKGIDGENVFIIKNVENVRNLDAFLTNKGVEDVVVVGGGFIGVEVAECLKHSGKNVSLVEGMDQVLAPFDFDFAQIMHKEILSNGINLIVGDSVTEIFADKVVLKSGKEIKAQAVIMSVGVRPDVEPFVQSGIELGETGAIKVDHNYQTNLPDVYAIGDAIEVHNAITNKKQILALAGPALKQARNVADGIFGRTFQNKGVIGSSCIRVFGLNGASTGLNEREAQRHGIDYRTAVITPFDRVKLIPGATPIHFKLVFQYPSGKILGAQAISKGDATKRIDVIATMITMGGTLYDLKDLELCYAPPFSTARDVVNYAALVGLNVLNEEYKQVPVSEVRNLVEKGEFILDVRGKKIHEKGHIKGATNIPLSQIRSRFNEIPRDRTVYIHCRTSWDSYYALRALQGLGFDNIVNIQGSFLGLSYYEYFTDVSTGRESILTDYNFN
ncbi:MAG: FAD-dependent oxidoreductase [Christensenellaceae bacterium]|nr:FAD-dependent oxidoreductase [Christensenellaceae bacterium]